jgi:hypothetical protein
MEFMPRSVGQWTGLAVTLIVALGCDRDVFYALPIGILAGAVAAGLVALDDWRAATIRKPAMARQSTPVRQD